MYNYMTMPLILLGALLVSAGLGILDHSVGEGLLVFGISMIVVGVAHGLDPRARKEK